jgi:hypothetical protein
MNLTDFRKQYPQYDDMSDRDLADALHGRFYADMPKNDFYQSVGIRVPSAGEDVARSATAGGVIGVGSLMDAFNPVNMAKDFARRTGDIVSLAQGNPRPMEFSTPATDRAMQVAYQPFTAPGRYAKNIATGAVTGAVGGPAGVVSGAGGAAGGEALGDVAAFTMGEGARPLGQLAGSFVGASGADAMRRAFQRPGQINAARSATESAKNAAYQAVDTSQVRVARSSVQDFVKNAREQLKRQGYVESAPEYASITRKLDELAVKPSSDLTPAGFDAWIKGLDNIAGGTSEATGLATKLKGMTNQFLDGVDVPEIRNARAANRKNESFKLADDVERRVTQRAPGTTKQTAAADAFRNISNDVDQMAYLTPAQRLQVDKAATTTGLQRVLREGGKLAPNRLLGFGAAGGAIGAGVAGGSGLALPFVGLNALGLGSEALYRTSVNNRTRAGLEALRNMPAQPRLGGLGALANMSQDELERMKRERDRKK